MASIPTAPDQLAPLIIADDSGDLLEKLAAQEGHTAAVTAWNAANQWHADNECATALHLLHEAMGATAYDDASIHAETICSWTPGPARHDWEEIVEALAVLADDPESLDADINELNDRIAELTSTWPRR